MRGMAVAVVAAASLAACASTPHGAWQALFDGHSTAGWHNVGKATLDPRWQVVDGALTLAPGGGDIISAAGFADFELQAEWQLATGGNSGLFYRAEDAEPVWRNAVEYQLLDDAAAEDRFIASHRAGAAYDLVAPAGAHLRPAGEYNRARIFACGPRVEHWLNGVRVAAYDLDSVDWKQRQAASKFAGEAGFAQKRSGHVAIQDHGAVLRLRSLRIRRLAGCG